MRPAGTPLDGKLERALRQLARDAAGQPHWAYAIRDPLTGDRRDWTTGDPFFVGQTNDPVGRAKAHLAAAAPSAAPEGEEGPAPHRARLAAILASGRAPIFELLEAAPTRLRALAAEARWARRFRAEGFEVSTAWDGRPSQGTEATEGFGETGVPFARVWSLTLGEAREDGVGLELSCEACGAEAPLPLDALAERAGLKARLSAIREALSCPNCGRGGALRLVPPRSG